MDYDWSSFTKSITIKGAADKLYAAFTTRKGMESWFLRKSEFKHPDGSTVWIDTANKHVKVQSRVWISDISTKQPRKIPMRFGPHNQPYIP